MFPAEKKTTRARSCITSRTYEQDKGSAVCNSSYCTYCCCCQGQLCFHILLVKEMSDTAVN